MRFTKWTNRTGKVLLLATILSLAPFGVMLMTGHAGISKPLATMAPDGNVLTAPLKVNPKLPPRKPAGSCHVNGELPDATCTPGVANAGVTQANIQQTICSPGYSSGQRKKYAPVSYTDALKRQQIREYGYKDTVPGDYEEDHLISLELGGHPNDPRNLWPEAPHSPNAKDKVEDELHKKVCSGQMTLAEAQRIISTDWTKAQ